MKIIKNLIIVFVISIVFVATGTKAASIYYTQETLAQYSTPASKTVYKNTDSMQKMYSDNCKTINGTTYRKPKFTLSHYSDSYNMGNFGEKTSFTLTKGETKNFGSYNTGVATRIGTQLMQISTNNSYSDTTYFWGTWTYDL